MKIQWFRNSEGHMQSKAPRKGGALWARVEASHIHPGQWIGWVMRRRGKGTGHSSTGVAKIVGPSEAEVVAKCEGLLLALQEDPTEEGKQ